MTKIGSISQVFDTSTRIKRGRHAASLDSAPSCKKQAALEFEALKASARRSHHRSQRMARRSRDPRAESTDGPNDKQSWSQEAQSNCRSSPKLQRSMAFKPRGTAGCSSARIFHTTDATRSRLASRKPPFWPPVPPRTGQTSALVIQGLPARWFAPAAKRPQSPTSDHRPTATTLNAVC